MAHHIRIDALSPSLCTSYVSCHLGQFGVACIALLMLDLPLYNAVYSNQLQIALHHYFKKIHLFKKLAYNTEKLFYMLCVLLSYVYAITMVPFLARVTTSEIIQNAGFVILSRNTSSLKKICSCCLKFLQFLKTR